MSQLMVLLVRRSLKQPFASVSEILVARFFSTGHYDQNNCSVEY